MRKRIIYGILMVLTHSAALTGSGASEKMCKNLGSELKKSNLKVWQIKTTFTIEIDKKACTFTPKNLTNHPWQYIDGLTLLSSLEFKSELKSGGGEVVCEVLFSSPKHPSSGALVEYKYRNNPPSTKEGGSNIMSKDFKDKSMLNFKHE